MEIDLYIQRFVLFLIYFLKVITSVLIIILTCLSLLLHGECCS